MVWGVVLAAVGGLLARAYANLDRSIGDDLWSHAAAVRALAENPVAPLHPFYGTAATSSRFTPYSLALGLWVRHTGQTPLEAFRIATGVNWMVLALGMGFLGRTVLGRGGGVILAVAMVLGWGGALNFSGSTALPDLPYVAGYPSTLALALGLVLLAMQFRYVRGGGAWNLAAAFPLQAAVTLIHPLVGAYAGLLAGGVLLTQGRAAAKRSVVFLGVMGLGTLASLLWPYYPMLRLLQGEAGCVVHWAKPLTEGIEDYQQYWFRRVFSETWFGWVMVPYLWAEARRHGGMRFAAVLWAISLVVFMVGTPLSSRLGDRLGVWMHFPLQMAAAHALWTALNEARGGAGRVSWRAAGRACFRAGSKARRWAIAGLAVCAVMMGVETVQRRLPQALVAPGPQPVFLAQQYARVLAGIGPGDVVMARPVEAWPVAALGGRMVLALRDDYFSPDRPERRRDVGRFFDPLATEDQRRDILRRWDVKYILYHRQRLSGEVVRALRKLGPVAGRTRDLVLIRVAPAGGLF